VGTPVKRKRLAAMQAVCHCAVTGSALVTRQWHQPPPTLQKFARLGRVKHAFRLPAPGVYSANRPG